MEPENIIKGRIAETLIEELLKYTRNKVYRFGYESILQNLVQTDSRFDRASENGQQVSSIPDFVVLNSSGNSFFVEVKFRSDPEWLKAKLLKRIKKYWRAKVILVTITKPYFRIADPRRLQRGSHVFQPLETDHDLGVTREALQKFEPLVERFLINGQGGHHEISAPGPSQR